MLNRLLPNLSYFNNLINTNINLSLVTKLLNNYFTAFNILNSHPIYNQNVSNTLIITVYYYNEGNNLLTNNSINLLANTIKNLLNGISIELHFVKLKYPYIDSNILAKYIAINTNQNKFNNIAQIIFESQSIIKSQINMSQYNNNPVHIIGIKITISGRLITETDRPRETVQSLSLGSFRKSPQTFIQKGSYRLVNNKGALTVKVLLCQQINNIS